MIKQDNLLICRHGQLHKRPITQRMLEICPLAEEVQNAYFEIDGFAAINLIIRKMKVAEDTAWEIFKTLRHGER